jgi:tetratricopeptide (TPR) repeat protein
MRRLYTLFLMGLLLAAVISSSALQAQEQTPTSTVLDPETTQEAQFATPTAQMDSVEATPSEVRLVGIDEIDPECPTALIRNPAPVYYIGLADVAFERGDFAEAVQVYSCAIRLQPDYAPNYVRRGFAYATLLVNDRAMADYNDALELDEALTSAYNNRGTLYTRMGNFGLAINDFTLAISLDPNDPIAYNNRGIVHAIEGNYDLAIDDFDQALTVAPEYTRTYASLAAVYSALAAYNYQRYMEIAGENGRLPAGRPDEVLIAIDDSLRNGDFTVWLSLLAPANR